MSRHNGSLPDLAQERACITTCNITLTSGFVTVSTVLSNSRVSSAYSSIRRSRTTASLLGRTVVVRQGGFTQNLSTFIREESPLIPFTNCTVFC